MNCTVLARLFGWVTVFASLSLGAAEPPNIVLIYLDDFGWRDCGYMGSDFYETPNLDALAAEGMVFDNAYSCAANCAPARACLLSGQYTPRHRIFNVGTGPRGKAAHRRVKHIPGVKTLDSQIQTWAQRLQAAGYTTATMGKWHLSDDPLPYGFDVNIGGTHSGGPPRGYYPPHGNVPGLAGAPKGEYVTDRLSREAVDFISDNAEQPWALYLTHFAVHTPLNAKRELVDKYEDKPPGELHDHVAMATMIQAVDDGVGKIVATLQRLKLRDRTAILFYSDNGGYGPATDMDPLKGYKGTYYEGGIRVPFFANYPGVVPAGQVSHQPIIGVDLYPTLCALGGAKLPSDQALDGVNLMPLLTADAEALPQRDLFWHFPAYLQSYRQVNDEQRDPLFRTRPCGVIRRGNWKLIEYFESGDTELFDLAADIGEENDLSQSRPEQRRKLLTAMRAWRARVDAPVPTQANPKFDPQAEAAAIKRRRDR